MYLTYLIGDFHFPISVQIVQFCTCAVDILHVVMLELDEKITF